MNGDFLANFNIYDLSNVVFLFGYIFFYKFGDLDGHRRRLDDQLLLSETVSIAMQVIKSDADVGVEENRLIDLSLKSGPNLNKKLVDIELLISLPDFPFC